MQNMRFQCLGKQTWKTFLLLLPDVSYNKRKKKNNLADATCEVKYTQYRGVYGYTLNFGVENAQLRSKTATLNTTQKQERFLKANNGSTSPKNSLFEPQF